MYQNYFVATEPTRAFKIIKFCHKFSWKSLCSEGKILFFSTLHYVNNIYRNIISFHHLSLRNVTIPKYKLDEAQETRETCFKFQTVTSSGTHWNYDRFQVLIVHQKLKNSTFQLIQS